MTISCISCLVENPDGTQRCTSCGSSLDIIITGGGAGTSITNPPLPIGTLLKNAQYKVEKWLGEGGFGITYKGIVLSNNATVAIKEMWPERALRNGAQVMWPSLITPQQKLQQLSKFKLEASNQQKCNHPSVAQVYDWFDENNTCYIVMQFIEGKSLSDKFKYQKPLQETIVKKYCLQLSEGLKVVHANNFIHRDIKPDNILIDSQDRAVLIDFGAAREFMSNQSVVQTVILTPGYAPYEQYASAAKRGPSTDFYALFASIYELLTGKVPVDAPDRAASIVNKSPDPLIPPRQLNPQISAPMERAILIGLQIRAEERFQNADEVIDALNGKIVSPLLRAARDLVAQGKLPEAAQTYEKLLNNEPNNGDAAIDRCLIQIHVDESVAEVAAQTAIQLKPNDGRAYGVLGLVNCRKNQWASAVQNLQQADRLTPQSAWIKSNLAWALGKTGDWAQAETAAQQAVQIDNTCTFTKGLQAWIALNQKNYKSTIRFSTPAIAQTKQHPSPRSTQIQYWLYPHLIMALEKAVANPNSQDVERRIQDCLVNMPKHSFVLGFGGWKHGSSEMWQEAMNYFQKALSSANPPAWVLLNAAIAHEHLGQNAEAVKLYSQYLQKEPNNGFIYYRLGTLQGQCKEWAKAKTNLEQSIKLQKDSAEAFHNLGWVLLNSKRDDGTLLYSRDIISNYRQASSLYIQNNQLQRSTAIQQVFKTINIDI
jgi:eukaryotic-like serine/threonine-protein kinase